MAESADINSPATQSQTRIMDNQWAVVQKKTFTKWVNNQLNKSKVEPIADIAEDFSDGVKLLQLLEVIGDENLGKYYKAPKLRIQKCENMIRALDFIKRRGVNLTNIGPEDLVDKNEKLGLGMIWTIILRFTIAEISEEGLTAKEGLLLWCQRKTAGYKDVNVKDFTFSWQDGLALCALIHKHRPDLLDFDQLDKKNRKENCLLAFDIAEKQLNIPKLLDVEDLTDITKPDERSVMTYVAQYFHAFSALDKMEVAGRRIGKFVSVAKNTWEMKHDYETRARQLLVNIDGILMEWSSSSFDDTYADAKEKSTQFQEYKASKKRDWVAEKRVLDTLLGNIQTKLKTYNMAPYFTPEGLSSQDLDNAWSNLAKSEAVRRKTINEKIQGIREKLRLRYSDLVNGFAAELNSVSQGLSSLDGNPENQLSALADLNDRIAKLELSLPEIKEVDASCNEAGVDESDRDYTVYSVDDLVFELSLVKAAIQKKESFLENQVVAQKMTNLTPQQIEEFEATFRLFDKNNSNTLSKIEFKACVQSLGNAMDDAEIEDCFAKVSLNAEHITFEQFTNFMVSITEDKTSSDQLMQSFLVISNHKDYITEQDIRAGQLAPELVEYLKQALPPKDGVPDAFDFQAYLSSSFE